jgi:hypothetical protein
MRLTLSPPWKFVSLVNQSFDRGRALKLSMFLKKW